MKNTFRTLLVLLLVAMPPAPMLFAQSGETSGSSSVNVEIGPALQDYNEASDEMIKKLNAVGEDDQSLIDAREARDYLKEHPDDPQAIENDGHKTGQLLTNTVRNLWDALDLETDYDLKYDAFKAITTTKIEAAKHKKEQIQEEITQKNQEIEEVKKELRRTKQFGFKSLDSSQLSEADEQLFLDLKDELIDLKDELQDQIEIRESWDENINIIKLKMVYAEKRHKNIKRQLGYAKKDVRSLLRKANTRLVQAKNRAEAKALKENLPLLKGNFPRRSSIAFFRPNQSTQHQATKEELARLEQDEKAQRATDLKDAFKYLSEQTDDKKITQTQGEKK